MLENVSTTMKRLTTSLLLSSSVSPAIADDTGITNKLFVEAVQLLRSADKAVSDEERWRLSEEALTNLNKIVKRYPSTDLAVNLVSDEIT